MSAAERAYRLLLLAYPPEFRAEYGREMLLLFADRRGEAGGATGLRFWAEMVWDTARSAPALRLEALRARGAARHIQSGEGAMKTMAILAMLVGGLEALNALSEAWMGGVTHGDPRSLAAGVLVAAAGVLLIVCGVAMLRRARRAATLARGAAVACLALFAVVNVAAPRLSIAATVLGVAFPLALLLFLRGTRGSSSVPTAA